MSRIQFVWWPWRFGWPRFYRWKGGLSRHLDYSLIFYPLEIRVWKAKRTDTTGETPDK